MSNLSLKKPKLIIVEPDQNLCKSYKRALKQKFDIKFCFSAEETLEELAHKLPDLIVIEMLLPLHNGIDILYDLQSYSDSKDVPVVINSYLSKDDLSISEEQFNQLSIYSYLYKPQTTPKKLLVELEKLNLVRA